MFNVPLVPVHGLSECAIYCRGKIEKANFLSHEAIKQKLSRFDIEVREPITTHKKFEEACKALAEQHDTGHLVLVSHREGIRIFSPSARFRRLPYCAVIECEYHPHDQRIVVPDSGLIHPPEHAKPKKK